jgi:hypothetical protein
MRLAGLGFLNFPIIAARVGREAKGEYSPAMLCILGQHGGLCDGLSRRELLTVGGLSLFG